MAVLQAVRHHVERSMPRSNDTGDCVAEMAAEDADLERRLVFLEAAAEMSARIMAEQASNTARVLAIVEKLVDRVLALEARVSQEHWQFLNDRVFELEEWQRGAR